MLEDVKEHLYNGVDVNGKDKVSTVTILLVYCSLVSDIV